MEQLQALFPSADLPALLAAQKLKAEATYRVEELELAEVCGALFQDENLDALKALLRFGLLRTAGNYLTQDIYNEMMVYQVSAQAGVLVTSDRVKENAENLDTLYASMARNLIKDLMSVYLEETYVDRRFSAEAKADMENMLRELIAVFRQRVENLDWMSDATKEGAFRKLDAMTLHVAYPDEWDTTISNATIAPVSEGGSAYQNWVELQKAQQDKKAAQQGIPVDNSGWHYQVYTANAGYNPQANLIEVPAGILQAPLYDVEASYEENLGGIGYVLAHEISHAFDNNGANYDEKGNAVNWWTEEDYAAFQALCQEVVEYYDGRECAPGITCDGTQTLSENIADIGALACITQIVSQQESPDFETLYRTAAKTWRTVVTRNTLELSKHTDIHAPDALRGQLPLQTCDEFYETFGITEGDGMWIPPEQRISIW